MREHVLTEDAAEAKRKIRRAQYLSLGLGELVAVAVFTFGATSSIFPRFDDRAARVALWWALAPLLAILFQGGCYWLMARRWVGRAPMPASVASLYRFLRGADVVLLAGGLAGVVWWWPEHTPTALLAIAVWCVGLVEYVNYFHIRLSYPLHRWFTTVGQWRRPQLVKDLRSVEREGPRPRH